MQRPRTLSLAVLFAVLSFSLAVSSSSYFSARIKAIDRTQASRSRIQAQIHETLHRRYAGNILETRLLGRCGFTVYVVTLRDTTGGDSTHFFDIETGAPIQHNLLNDCPASMSGSATALDADINTGV
jgi:hypothetical protein